MLILYLVRCRPKITEEVWRSEFWASSEPRTQYSGVPNALISVIWVFWVPGTISVPFLDNNSYVCRFRCFLHKFKFVVVKPSTPKNHVVLLSFFNIARRGYIESSNSIKQIHCRWVQQSNAQQCVRRSPFFGLACRRTPTGGGWLFSLCVLCCAATTFLQFVGCGRRRRADEHSFFLDLDDYLLCNLDVL